MKKILFVCLLFVILHAKSQQQNFQFWSETGFSGKLNSKLEYGVEWNNRFGNYNLQTSFGQFTLKYKLKKWCKPSIDYRLISDREKNSNYTVAHRLNFNLQFEKNLNRLQFGLRTRYQYSFNQILTVSNYEPEFDQAFRIKPSISYDFNNFILTPQISTEFFYNPSNFEYGDRFSKIRYTASLGLDIKSPHKIDVAYIFDQRIQTTSPLNRYVICLNYNYQIKKNKKQKKEPRN